jgi:flagellar biosynthetic protein FlhB
LPGQEKTEKATPKKRKDARNKEGNVLQSKEVNTAFSILGIFFTLSIVGRLMYRQMLRVYEHFLGEQVLGAEVTPSTEYITQTAIMIITLVVSIVGIILLAAIVLGTIPSIFQTKGLFTMKPLKPKFSKLNPITGMKKFFSIQAAVNVIKGILTIGIIIFIVYLRVSGLLPEIKSLTQVELEQGVVFIARNIFQTVMTIVAVFAFICALDYIFQWWQYERKLKMSKQEVKDEYKQIEGDPIIKSRIKQKQREIAQNRMMQEVPSSDVVVRNPTHFAVALRYEPSMLAPLVVAKGQDAIAMKIIAIAEEHGVAVQENRQLARDLHNNVKIGAPIPFELFTAIAEIFAELESIKKKMNFDD